MLSICRSSVRNTQIGDDIILSDKAKKKKMSKIPQVALRNFIY